jgi:ABC-type thiamine transport system ATPase subunit
MRLRRLTIENFRGIRSADWRISSDLVALIGSGDSGKSTILASIELALSPQWNPRLSDNDFHNLDPEAPIKIEATVGELPAALCEDRKYGLELRGLSSDGTLHDEPDEDDEFVLTIRFELDASLEPRWSVVNDRLPDGKPISARDRGSLGMVRLGGSPDRHLGWRGGSALERMTQRGDETSRVLADAQREMREAINAARFEELDSVIERAQLAATQMGAGAVADQLRPALDAAEASRARALSLHGDMVPLSRSGLGTRRLVALGLERLVVPTGALMLVDEIETGLEPFRLRHLLSLLRDLVTAPESGQIFFTTHSPVVVAELEPNELHVVGGRHGNVQVHEAPAVLRPQLRSTPEAFLARRLMVCEGKTEIGLCRALSLTWSAQHGSRPLAHSGTALALGGGSQTAERAMGLAELGYEVMVFADSDRPLDPTPAELAAAGVAVTQWGGRAATEDRVVADLPLEGVQQLLDIAVEEWGEPQVLDAVRSKLPDDAHADGSDLQTWIGKGVAEADARLAFAAAARKKEWFKRVDLGSRMGEVIVSNAENLQGTDTWSKLEQLRRWAYRS